jgi:hypothetical protein
MSVVLDTSAMVAYARGGVAVGELIVMVAEEGNGTVALPVVALADAYGRADDADHPMLALLSNGTRSRLVRLDPATVDEVGSAGRRVGLGTAHALKIAVDFDRYLVTADAKSIAGMIEDRLILEI